MIDELFPYKIHEADDREQAYQHIGSVYQQVICDKMDGIEIIGYTHQQTGLDAEEVHEPAGCKRCAVVPHGMEERLQLVQEAEDH